MKKQLCIGLSIAFMVLFGCKKKENQTQKNEDSFSVTIFKKEQDSLYIEGSNIWIRDNPKKGKILMKLNTGDRCVVLDTGKVDTIKGCIDYWYQIKHHDTIGWVFGSQTDIKSERSKETLLFLKQNREKLKCNNLDYTFINQKKKSYYTLSNIILFAETDTLGVLDFREKALLSQEKKYAQIIKEDYNFDGLCDFIFIDDMSASHGSTDSYYFLYDLETKGFIEDTSLPKRNGGIKINANKKEVIIYCSYQDCEVSYKFIDGKFKRVSGTFTLEP